MPRKSDVDPNFQKQVVNLQVLKAAEATARRTGQQVKHFMPVQNDWNGDLGNVDGIKSAFNRDQANAELAQVVSSADSPGVSGDIVATTTQIDYLSCMERAFRARHHGGFARAVALSAGRSRGQGQETGTIVAAALDYVRGIHKQSS